MCAEHHLEKPETTHEENRLQTLGLSTYTSKHLDRIHESHETFSLGTPINVIHTINQYADELNSIFSDIVQGDKRASQKTKQLSIKIQALFRHAPDACLAAVHLNHRLSLGIMQPLYAAILCALSTDSTSLDHESQHILICAALTANISLFPETCNHTNSYYEANNTNPGIKYHPQDSTQLLQQAGIDNELWLKIVAQHHERNDGTGYPFGLIGDEITHEVAIYSIVDSYLSHILPYPNRTSNETIIALQKTYKNNQCAGEILLNRFVKRIGIYPAGTLVETDNKEIAIVIKRNSNSAIHPLVVSFMNSKYHMLDKMEIRDTASNSFRILRSIEHSSLYNIDIPAIYNSALGMIN